MPRHVSPVDIFFALIIAGLAIILCALEFFGVDFF